MMDTRTTERPMLRGHDARGLAAVLLEAARGQKASTLPHVAAAETKRNAKKARRAARAARQRAGQQH